MDKQINKFDKVNKNAGIMGYKPQFTEVNGIKTRYYDVGEGTPLILLHGGNWSGLSNANRWTESFKYLAKEFRVLAPDRIGCGMTDNPKSMDDYRFKFEINHILAFLDHIGIKNCHLSGFSRGAGLASCVAVENPDKFKSLTVTNSNTFGPPKGDFQHRWGRIADGLENMQTTDPEYIEYKLRQHSYVTDYITEERCKAAAYMECQPKRVETAEVIDDANANPFDLPSGRAIRDHIEEAQQEIRKGKLEMPVMFMYGRNGVNDPVNMALSGFDIFAQANPLARMKIINHCGHMIMLEHPEEFSQTIINFINFHLN